MNRQISARRRVVCAISCFLLIIQATSAFAAQGKRGPNHRGMPLPLRAPVGTSALRSARARSRQSLAKMVRRGKPAVFQLAKRFVDPRGLRRVPTVSSLDLQGHYRGAATLTQRRLWRADARVGVSPRSQRGTDLVKLGEYELGARYPVEAIRDLRAAIPLLNAHDCHRGLAVYDVGLAQYFSGRYSEAQATFDGLLRGPLCGYKRNMAALFLKHSQACAGYHRYHSAKGIPEPAALDPLCGVSSMAVCLKYNHLPCERRVLIRAVSHTGEGSSFTDLQIACPLLGLSFADVMTGDSGLRDLPKPLVAYVEQDHFVAVTKADNAGVNYVCSDCGPWPGGEIHLTWSQWHLMQPGRYLAIARKGSVDGLALDELQSGVISDGPLAELSQFGETRADMEPPRTEPKAVLASLLSGLLGPEPVPAPKPSFSALAANRARALLAAQVDPFSLFNVGPPPQCGQEGTPFECASYDRHPATCPMSPNGSAGSAADPVNLATGEEDYAAPEDLHVYNPIGPSISWQRSYMSLGNPEPCGLGLGWTEPYNTKVVIPFSNGAFQDPILVLQNGYRFTFTPKEANWQNNPPTQGQTPLPTQGEPAGTPFNITWQYSTAATVLGSAWVVELSNRTTWAYTYANIAESENGTEYYEFVPTQITDHSGNSIALDWANGETNTIDPDSGSAVGPTLVDIKDSSGNYLLSLNYDSSGDLINMVTGGPAGAGNNQAPVGVSYSYESKPTGHVQTGPLSYMVLEGMADVSAASFSNGTWTISNGQNGSYVYRDAYGYGQVGNNEYHSGAEETVPILTSITRLSPNATSSGSSAPYTYSPETELTEIDYDTTYGTVKDIITNPGNPFGEDYNTLTITPIPNNMDNGLASTEVTLKGTGQSVDEAYYASWDSNMQETHRDLVTQFNSPNNYTIRPYTATNSAADPFEPASVTDSNNLTWNLVWDAYGNLLAVTSPKGIETAYTWTNANLINGATFPDELTQVTRYDGATVEQTPIYYHYFEPSGNLEYIKAPIPGQSNTGATQETDFTYTTSPFGANQGQLASLATQFGNNSVPVHTLTLNYTSDPVYQFTQAEALGQPVTIAGSLSHLDHFRYDSHGNLASSWDASGRGTARSYQYNVADQLTELVFPCTGQQGTNNSYVLLTYAALNPNINLTYSDGPPMEEDLYSESGSPAPYRTHFVQYGPEGEVRQVSNDQLKTQYAYDAAFRVTSVTDGRGNSTVFAFNPAGEEQTMTYPDGSYYSFPNSNGIGGPGYDGAGRLTERVDANGKTTQYGYGDGDGNLNSISYQDGTSVSLTYDNFDRLTSLTDSTGTYGALYDDLDNPTQTSTTLNGQAENVINYVYYPDGAPKTESSSLLSSPWTFYYDGDSRMTEMTTPEGETNQWLYQVNGWLQEQEDSNGASAFYKYDNLGRLTDLTNKNSSGILSEFTVPSIPSTPTPSNGYDASGNVLSETVSVPGYPNFSGTITNSPDALDQLTINASTQPALNYNQAYSADASGNLTQIRSVSGYGYNSRDQLTLNGYQYLDKNGNPTSYAGQSLTWDQESRMTSFGSEMSATYRSDGLRASKTAGSTTTDYIYDIFGNPVIETQSGNVTAVNTFGPNGLVSRYSGSPLASTFYQFDERGDTVARLNSSGAVQDYHCSDAYGKQYYSAASTDPYQGFGAQWGYYRDSETGRFLLGHRYYDALYGRFLNQDPSGTNAGVNAYSYAGNQPTTQVDPDGRNGADAELARSELQEARARALVALIFPMIGPLDLPEFPAPIAGQPPYAGFAEPPQGSWLFPGDPIYVRGTVEHPPSEWFDPKCDPDNLKNTGLSPTRQAEPTWEYRVNGDSPVAYWEGKAADAREYGGGPGEGIQGFAGPRVPEFASPVRQIPVAEEGAVGSTSVWVVAGAAVLIILCF